jgi:flagellar biosynthesis/type III secretory pathway M-ring protein FliF/YscJ
MDTFKRALEAIGRMWGNLNSSQRVLLAALAAGLVLFLAWGSAGGVGESMVKVVGHEIPEAERGDVLKELQKKNVKYEVRNLDIYVPREEAERVVLELAGDGVMSDRAIWGFLAESDIVTSKWQLDKRYQVALQRKLEMMIRKIDGVRGASVVLSFASEADRLGFRDGAKASATVQVELRPNAPFNRGQAKAVGTLVARAVPGLDTDRVVLTDTQGRSYSLPRDNSNTAVSDGIREIEARLEEDIKAKIVDLFPWPPRVVVRVVAKSTYTETDEKIFGSPKVVEVEENKRVEKVKPQGGPGGIKGESQLVLEVVGTPAKDETEQSFKEKSAIDLKMKKEIDPSGAIQKITVGVLIPVTEGDKAPMSEEDAKKFVLAAVGGQADVAGAIVKFLPTKRPDPPAPVTVTQQILEVMGAKWATILAVVLALIGLVFLFRIVKGGMPNGTVEEIRSLTAQLAEGPELEVPQPVLTGPDNINRVKQGIQDVISRNPSGAAVGLKQWMGEQNK